MKMIAGEEDMSFWADSDSDVSEVSSGGYEADVEMSDDDDDGGCVASPQAQDEDNVESVWKNLHEELCAIAEDQEEINRPDE